jgi:hypothetical protein
MIIIRMARSMKEILSNILTWSAKMMGLEHVAEILPQWGLGSPGAVCRAGTTRSS